LIGFWAQRVGHQTLTKATSSLYSTPLTVVTSPAKPPQPPPRLSTKILSTLRSARTPHEKIWNIPNILTFSRLAAAPAVGYCILTSHPTLALTLFFYAGVTDLIDGYLARRLHQQTVVGTVIDPMADKALMTISVVALAMQGGIPVWLAGLILARDVGLAVSAIYVRWISLPPPKTMARYWDFSLPSAEVRPTEISKVNTFLQLLLVGAGMAMPVLPGSLVEAWRLAAAFDAFQYVVAATTVWSGASYAYSKNAFKILSQREIEERMKEKEEQRQQRKEADEGEEKPR
jgi:cardiolipin synthase (CMP-forming)